MLKITNTKLTQWRWVDGAKGNRPDSTSDAPNLTPVDLLGSTLRLTGYKWSYTTDGTTRGAITSDSFKTNNWVRCIAIHKISRERPRLIATSRMNQSQLVIRLVSWLYTVEYDRVSQSKNPPPKTFCNIFIEASVFLRTFIAHLLPIYTYAYCQILVD